MKARIILITLAVAAGAACGGAGSGGPGGETPTGGGGGRLEVVAGFYPLAYAAEQVGGEAVAVRNLTPPGVEPHDLELTPRDAEAVRSADLVLYLGGGFQPALEEVARQAEGEALDLLAGIELRPGGDHEPHGEEEDGEHGARPSEEHGEEDKHGDEPPPDPHVWLDPELFAGIAERIGEALGRPQAAAALAEELRALDAELAAGLADCDRRTIVTSHEAFGYLAARYDLEEIGVTGLSPEAEPTPRDLERVVEAVRESGATTVFFETLVSPRLAETVARETGAATAVLNPLEGLTEEELERGEDYVSVMRANLAALREGLGCR